ncbi:hypothetical protein [Salinicoccus roseus]|uniref:hypothetical protein n=1 Tax=Salinicoccus roseus TaxID=45670 RepID=UPI001EF44D4C|nr:hypothetical protein [Salinicoccus roseus]MCG7332178.1 hypothetical protein [Salinicoccus roseus]
MNITVSKVEESGQELLVKSSTYEDDKAVGIYNRLTDEYADQTLPFFDEGEKLIRLDIVPEQKTDEDNKEQKECYFEFSEPLLEELSGHI